MGKSKPPKAIKEPEPRQISRQFVSQLPQTIARSNNTRSLPFLPQINSRLESVQAKNDPKPLSQTIKVPRAEKQLYTIFQFYAKKNVQGNNKHLVTFEQMLQNSKSLNLQEFLKLCKVFAVPLSSKKCLAVFKQVADPANVAREDGRRARSLPKPRGDSQPLFTLDFTGFKTAL